MAAGVVGQRAGRLGADVGDAEHARQEDRQLVGARGQRPRLRAVLGIVAEQRHVLVDHHVAARAGRHDHRIVAGAQHVDGVARQGARLGVVAGVEGGLTATGLAGRNGHGDAGALEHADDGFARAREEAIDQARDQQLHARGSHGRQYKMGGHALAAVRVGWTHARRLPARRRRSAGHPAGRGRDAAGRHRRPRHGRRRRGHPARRRAAAGAAAARQDPLHRPQLHGPLPRAEDRAARSADPVRQVPEQRDRAGRADPVARRLQRAGRLRSRARRRDRARDAARRRGGRAGARLRLHRRQRRHRPRRPARRQAVDPRQGRRHLLPARPGRRHHRRDPRPAAAADRLPRQRRDAPGVAHPRDDLPGGADHRLHLARHHPRARRRHPDRHARRRRPLPRSEGVPPARRSRRGRARRPRRAREPGRPATWRERHPWHP